MGFDDLGVFADNIKGTWILQVEVLLKVDVGYGGEWGGLVGLSSRVSAGTTSDARTVDRREQGGCGALATNGRARRGVRLVVLCSGALEGIEQGPYAGQIVVESRGVDVRDIGKGDGSYVLGSGSSICGGDSRSRCEKAGTYDRGLQQGRDSYRGVRIAYDSVG